MCNIIKVISSVLHKRSTCTLGLLQSMVWLYPLAGKVAAGGKTLNIYEDMIPIDS